MMRMCEIYCISKECEKRWEQSNPGAANSKETRGESLGPTKWGLQSYYSNTLLHPPMREITLISSAEMRKRPKEYMRANSKRTCTHSQLCRCASVWGSWLSLDFRKSSWARWSVCASLHMQCPCTGRRAARAYSRPGRGQRTYAEPCCTWVGCTSRTWPWVWYKLRRTLCASSGIRHPRCKPWLHPSSDLPLSCQPLSLCREERSQKQQSVGSNSSGVKWLVLFE